MIVRHAIKSDCEDLLRLMKKLAEFEDYIDNFSVTTNDLIAHGFSQADGQVPNFTAIVAEDSNKLTGYLIYYLIPFTYDLKPTLFIKELYVDEKVRGKSIGKKLMKLAITDAKEKGCGRMKWDVLSDNINAQSFYKSFGAKYDPRWQGFALDI